MAADNLHSPPAITIIIIVVVVTAAVVAAAVVVLAPVTIPLFGARRGATPSAAA
jgi:hypothetical protein